MRTCPPVSTMPCSSVDGWYTRELGTSNQESYASEKGGEFSRLIRNLQRSISQKCCIESLLSTPNRPQCTPSQYSFSAGHRVRPLSLFTKCVSLLHPEHSAKNGGTSGNANATECISGTDKTRTSSCEISFTKVTLSLLSVTQHFALQHIPESDMPG